MSTLDDYLEGRAVNRVDLVKIDVEGFERSVMAGMSGVLGAGKVDRVQFEFNAHNAMIGFTLHEAGQMLAGYDVFKLLANGTQRIIGDGVKYDSSIEIYKYANYVAVRAGA